MKELTYEFTDLEHEVSFQSLAQLLGGFLTQDSLTINNAIAKGEIIRKLFHEGLSICNWKLAVYEKLKIRKLPPAPGSEKKLTLIYVLSTSNVLVSSAKKKIRIQGSRNNLFWGNETPMDFNLQPKQSFHLFEISFTTSWLLEQLKDADPHYRQILEDYIKSNEQKTLIEPLTIDEYKTLHELQAAMLADKVDDLFIRARAYAMLCNFFGKLDKRQETPVSQAAVQFDQIIEAEMMILEDIRKPPSIASIARKVNMSVSSLLRRFKLVYGKSMHEYYVDKKMELARKMIIENRLAVKDMARMLGYNQPSAFIEIFTKQHGYSPGALKNVSNQFLFF
jgi:AraC-like DNA-binding protein